LNTSFNVIKKHMLKKHEKFLNKNINNIDMSNNITENDVYNAFAIYFSKKSLPYSIVSDSNFINLIKLYNSVPNLNMSSYKLKKTVIKIGNQLVDDATINMNINKYPVTI